MKTWVWILLTCLLVCPAAAWGEETREPDLSEGVELLGAERYEEAAEFFRRAVEANPGLVPAWRHLALAFTELGRKDPQYFYEAQGVFDKLETLVPGKDMQTFAGRTYLEGLMGQFERAERTYESILQQTPEDCEIWSYLSRVMKAHALHVRDSEGIATEKYRTLTSQAGDAYLRYLEVCATDFEDYESLYNLLDQGRRPVEGAAIFERLRKKSPDNLYFNRCVAYFYFQARDWEQAGPAFARLLEMDPEAMEDRLKYISVLYKLEKKEEGDEQLQIYIKQRDEKQAEGNQGR